VNLLVLVVDDEPDVEVLFRRQFRRELRKGRRNVAPSIISRSRDLEGPLRRVDGRADQSMDMWISDFGTFRTFRHVRFSAGVGGKADLSVSAPSAGCQW
jgi:hypothetical protein